MPRRKSEELHAARRRQILDAAKRCFVTHGFHQTSMRQILDAAGLSAGGAYSYFSGKADIVKGIVEEVQSDIALLEARMKEAEDPVAAVARLVSDVVLYTSREDAVLALQVDAEGCRDPEIQELVRVNTERIKRLISAEIRKGRRSGVIGARGEVAELTEWVVALYEGYLSRRASAPGFRPKSSARVARESVVCFLGR